MTLDEIYKTAFDAKISRSVIGFVDGPPETSVKSIGSGTLIKFADIGGVLTCAHVIEALRATAVTGIVTFPVRSWEFQNTTFDLAKCGLLKIGAPPWTEGGADLALIILDPTTFSALCRLGSPIDLERQSSFMLSDGPETPCIEAVAGVVGEWSVDKTLSPTGRGVMKALLSQGQITSRSPLDPNAPDIITFRPDDPKELVPTSYGGVSGGGFWRINIQDDGGPEKLTLLDVQLLGVAFWQTKSPNRNILCHGPKDLYHVLLPLIREYRDNMPSHLQPLMTLGSRGI